jgi:hypothetical protein
VLIKEAFVRILFQEQAVVCLRWLHTRSIEAQPV